MIQDIVQTKIKEIFTDCDVAMDEIEEFNVQRLERCIKTIENIVKEGYTQQHKQKIDDFKSLVDGKVTSMLAEVCDKEGTLFSEVDEELAQKIIKDTLCKHIKRVDELHNGPRLCPVCGAEIIDENSNCPNCNFEEVAKRFDDNQEYIEWLKEKAIPHGVKYVLSDMLPTEARRVKLTLGLIDGIKHTDEEVAEMENACVNRIYQHKATFWRRLKRLPCSKKLNVLEGEDQKG